MTPDRVAVEGLIGQLKEIISEKMDVNISRDEINPDVSLFEDGLGLDSIAIVEFITLIEENTGYRFKEGGLDMDNFKTYAH
ncbi:MAG: acyl carrier protein [Candidatus Thiothrix singaporensis]|uniref:Acyl carrier protein n=1 Tax=Candidatus Thiothrix singaporensis TaxID=2799669 RepID=A0A7L6AZH6_9GAMM|nr:MAG: acyl carrier protein [Candidatus Thiothrix singaporensis]